ncbi:nuclease-related domain-containing protein [Gracilibacillus saliphilus]|uniref:nuclease-related domain-containing protein n=1 Tax=Gracilibacillus saliphilus TaxID=543890 RepID=UPI0013D4D2EF|nr:nuclease-related domain-containing protein [Gracilibacillus saliphilus]
MILKPLKKPYELQVFEALDSRFTFTQKEISYFHNLKLGYEGEKTFEQLLRDSFNDDYLIISDIRLEVGTTSFQIDSILLTADTLYFFDVKNLPGNYIHIDKRWYKLPNKEVNNPLLQLKRSETLMRQVLQELHADIQIECYDVFVNPEFTLYQAPMNKQLILPTQLPQLMRDLATKPPATASQQLLAKQLIARDIGKYQYPKIPKYRYHQFKKGFRCSKCYKLSVYIEGRNCICTNCQQMESIQHALMRTVKELLLLFPDKKLTTNLIYDWCGKGYSKKSIQRFLDRNFQKVGVRQWTYYK